MSETYGSITDTVRHKISIRAVERYSSLTNTVIHNVYIVPVFSGKTKILDYEVRFYNRAYVYASTTNTTIHVFDIAGGVPTYSSVTDTVHHLIQLGVIVREYYSKTKLLDYNVDIKSISPVIKAVKVRIYRAYSFANLSDVNIVKTSDAEIIYPKITTPGSVYSIYYYNISRRTERDLVLASGHPAYTGYPEENISLETFSPPPSKITYAGIIGSKSRNRLLEIPVELLAEAYLLRAGTPIVLVSDKVYTHPAIVAIPQTPRLHYYSTKYGLYITGSLILINTSMTTLPISELPIGLRFSIKPSDIFAKVTLTPRRDLPEGQQIAYVELDLTDYINRFGKPIYSAISVVDPELYQIVPSHIDMATGTNKLHIRFGYYHPGGTQQRTIYICIPSKNYVGGISETAPINTPQIIGSGTYYDLDYEIEGWYQLGDNELYDVPVDYKIDIVESIQPHELREVNYELYASIPCITAPCKIHFFSIEPIGDIDVYLGEGVTVSYTEPSITNSYLETTLIIDNKNIIEYRDIPLMIRVFETSTGHCSYEEENMISLIPSRSTTRLWIKVPVPVNYKVEISSPLFTITITGSR